MKSANGTPAPSEAAIFARLIRTACDTGTAEVAKALLAIRLQSQDLDRMHELVTKNQDDALTPAEKAEMANYRRVSSMLDLMHSLARRALKKHRAVP